MDIFDIKTSKTKEGNTIKFRRIVKLVRNVNPDKKLTNWDKRFLVNDVLISSLR